MKRRHERHAEDQRGFALPVALVALSVLMALMVAFALLASTEPVIANNHAMSARARATAESGVEQALWALSHPTATGGISEPMPSSPAPPPYDGTAASFRAVELVNGVSQAGFIVSVANAASGRPNERDIVSVGFVPAPGNPRAVKRIAATAMKLTWLDPPCALCLGGESPDGITPVVQITGNTAVNASDAAGPTPATYCAGQVPASAILTTGVVANSGNPAISAPPAGTSIIQGEGRPAFATFTLSDSDLAILRVLARANGTYYQGAQTFTAPPPNGLVFIDTLSGNPLTHSSPPSDLFEVDIHGNWSNGWRGWFIAAGRIRLAGQIDMTGLIYSQNTIEAQLQGEGRVRGAIIASQRIEAVSSLVGSGDVGGGGLTYDCPAVRSGGGALPGNWFLKPGTYREVASP